MTRNWDSSFARRSAQMHLTAVSGPSYPAASPDFISLRSGAPPVECVPVEWLAHGMERTWGAGGAIFGYASATGSDELRALVAAQMHAAGATDVTPEHIMLLSGAQQGLDFLARLLVDDGDAIAIEDPVYPGAIQVFDLCHPRYLAVPVGSDGIDRAVLEQTFQRDHPKFLYTVPTFQNPTGVSMSHEARHALVALCNHYGVPIIEDDPYGELFFGETRPQPLRALDPDVLYLGTFSKTIAPGIRVGWMVTPPALWDKLYALKEAADINSDRIMQQAVYEALQTGFYPGHLARIRAVYRERRDAICAALTEYMPPDTTWQEPQGGFFVWLRLPAGMRVADVEAAGLTVGVGIVPGTGCTVTPGGQTDAMRLSFCANTPAVITEGVRRLAAAIEAVRTSANVPEAVPAD